MRERHWRTWLSAAMLGLCLAACTSPVSRPEPAPPTTSAPSGSYDPARFAPIVWTRAKEAGASPRLVMAILFNESYKPHDPALERAWQRLKPGAAFGVANMHEATFNATKKGRAFAGRSWDQLPDDPDLAIQAESWYLHDLAGQLPAHRSGSITPDELLALGYNAGPAAMKSFARGTKPGAQAQSYLDNLRENWAKAGKALGEP
ncbi:MULTISPECIES: transglycosylase SLT domain-containing protein [Amycolatopsis]|uniref:Lytic transglycosylase domain-containing protein n=1 Tax=Amycolatopsis dendrobii TaxID=2760662 RepID=A0A7W3ZEV5_9PSEU|nr:MULTISPECIES: transglycosylase SLT domain-containing protein [Amycolatopsis]MBB1158428.1 lytic transglycosylase domain-containing protein [Amycolatopsis dendrobii]UKD56932.1 lytic transglycosylase domain-containing protein [Amycolatopsis sp. FU40]